MATVNQIVYSYLLTESNMTTAFTGGFYYVLNDNKKKQPYATIYMIDDPQDNLFLCPTNQGQARFGCDVFTDDYIDGINKRQIYMDAIKGLESTTSSGVNIWKVDNVNAVDRSERINGLFMYSFESIVSWEN